MLNNKETSYERGVKGEKRAISYLKSKGYLIFGNRIRSVYGEIDIVCFDKEEDYLVFVEVKSSQSYNKSFFYPIISKKQILRIKNAAYNNAINYYADYTCRMRIDIILVSQNFCQHIQNCFL